MNTYTSERFARDRFDELRGEASGDHRVQLAEAAAASADPGIGTARALAPATRTRWTVARLLGALRVWQADLDAGLRKATGRSG